MARIFQFPKMQMHRGDGGQHQDPPLGGLEYPWRELWENPITQAFYRLFLAFVICTWPVLRWFVALDLFIQLLRLLFVGGFSGLAALMHMLIIGLVAYMVLHVRPLPRR